MFKSISLSVKLTLITIIVGIIVGVISDYVYTYMVETIFYQKLSLIPYEQAEVDALSREILSSDRRNRIAIISALILSFAIIIFWVARHIQRLTSDVLDSSSKTLNTKTTEVPKGDELYILEDKFKHFSEELIEHTNKLKTEIEERKKKEEELRKSEASYKEISDILSTSLKEAQGRETDLLNSREAFLNMLEDNSDSYKALEELFIGLVRVMVGSLDAKSPWTKGHSERVSSLAEQIAKKMGLDEDDVKDIRLAGLLHDIGKIGTYDYLLDKPARLTEEEFEMVKKHPTKGTEILSGIKQLKDLLPFISHHHERIDGRGYPDGLKGDDIPLQAKILCVADSFDSMTADRPYRPSPGTEYAISELKRCSGTQFDPLVVDSFLKILGQAT